MNDSATVPSHVIDIGHRDEQAATSERLTVDVATTTGDVTEPKTNHNASVMCTVVDIC
jgi:hypothetical protein